MKRNIFKSCTAHSPKRRQILKTCLRTSVHTKPSIEIENNKFKRIEKEKKQIYTSAIQNINLIESNQIHPSI